MPEETAVQDNSDAVEKKRRGKPPKSDKPAAKVAEKRKVADAEAEEAAEQPAPVKRGRGRPPKAGGPAKKAPKVPGRGRGRPPKKAPKKAESAEESE